MRGVIAIYLYGSAAKAKDNRFRDVDLGVLVDSSVRQEDYFNIESIVATNQLTDVEVEL